MRVDLQTIIKGMRDIVRCPSCSAEYSMSDIKLIGWVDDNCFLRLMCVDCSLSAVAMVSSPDQIANMARGELSAGEKTRTAGEGVITALEIAEFHRRMTHSKSLIS